MIIAIAWHEDKLFDKSLYNVTIRSSADTDIVNVNFLTWALNLLSVWFWSPLSIWYISSRRLSSNATWSNVKLPALHQVEVRQKWLTSTAMHYKTLNTILPEVYKGIARAWITWSCALASRHVTFTCARQRTSLSFTDEGLSIRGNVCYQLLRASGKTFP